MKTIVDALITEKSIFFIFNVVIIYGAFNIFEALLKNYDENILTTKLNVLLSSEINNVIMQKAVTLDIKCYDQTSFYVQYTKALQESDSRTMAVLNNFLDFIKNILTILSLVAVILTLNRLLFIFVIIACILRIFIFPKQYKYRYQLRQKKVPIERKLSFIKGVFSNREFAKDIRCTKGIKDFLLIKFHKSIDESLDINIKIGKKIFFLNLILNLLDTIFTYVLPYLYLGYSVLAKRITAGSVAALYSTMQMLSYAISDIVGNITEVKNNSLYIDDLLYILEYENTIEVEEVDVRIKCKSIEKIEFKNVSFGYSEDKMVLNDLSFVVEKGERIAIVGHNGAGKSTLIKLILRLYDVQDGSILINDIDIKEYCVKSLRDTICTVFQDFNVYPFTIIENITMSEDVCEDSICKAGDVLSKVNLDEKINQYPDGVLSNVTTQFYPDGVLFSGGELQKLALSRAFYNKETSLFIFDEPSAALDPISEDNFYQNMLKLIDGKISIIITHRLSSLSMSDKVCFMKNGIINDFDSLDNVLESNREFYDYYTLQSKNYKYTLE